MRSKTWLPSSLLLFLALLALYLGERVGEDVSRWVMSGTAGVLYLGALGLGALRYKQATGERQAAVKSLLLHYGLVGLAGLVYGLQLEELGWLTGAARELAQVLAPALLLLGALPAIAVELSIRAAGDSPHVEGWRTKVATRAARTVFFALCAFAGLNYAAAKWNRKIDLSYFQTTRVGTANLALAKELTQPVELLLFFPVGNEVLEQVSTYAEGLARASDKITVRRVDQALDPDLARKYKVRANGYLGIGTEDRQENLRIGLEMERATTVLRKLDREVHERLIKVLRPPRVAYLTTGHLERDYSPPSDDRRRGLADFRQVLDTLGFKIQRLGAGEGLASEIPNDASVVIVAGPLEPFLPAEVDTLNRYLQGGGRVMFMIDPDQGSTGDELLAPLGLRVSKSLVAASSLQHQWRIEGQGDSVYNLATNQTGTHPSVDVLHKGRGRLAVLMAGAGELSKREDAPKNAKITFTVRTMPKAYVDANGNGKPDEGENLTTVDLAAAVELEAQGEGEPGRAVVYADADLASNGVVRNQGNYAMLMDALRWLAGDSATGEVEEERDVRITHRRDEDRIWFYGSSVLMPISVLGAGLFYTRRTRRREERSSAGGSV